MKATDPLAAAVSRFGASLKPKFAGLGAQGAPEDQLRSPFEGLLRDLVGGASV